MEMKDRSMVATCGYKQILYNGKITQGVCQPLRPELQASFYLASLRCIQMSVFEPQVVISLLHSSSLVASKDHETFHMKWMNLVSDSNLEIWIVELMCDLD